MEDVMGLSFSGIYSILILSLTFNFLLAIKMHVMDRQVTRISDHAREEAKSIEERMARLKDKYHQQVEIPEDIQKLSFDR